MLRDAWPLLHAQPHLTFSFEDQTKIWVFDVCRLTLDKEDIEPWGEATKDEVLLYAALSAKWENNDAIDRAVTGAVGSKESLRGYKIEQVVPFNPVDKKTTVAFTGHDGRRLLACKGAPQVCPDEL